MQVLLQDLRFALRQIYRNLGFSLTAVLSLTLGIGATVAVYSILYDAVLHPWPYAGIERICDVWMTDNAGHDGTWDLTGPQIRQLRQAHAVEDVVASSFSNETITGGDVPDDVRVVEMTGSHIQFLGLPPLLGRYFAPSDAPDGQDPQPVAVMSFKFWQRHYRGDPAAIGKTIQLNHKTYTILGVMPVRFTWGDGEVYVPMNMASNQTHRYSTKIKLKPGISFAAAEGEFRPLYQEFDRQTPNVFPKQFKISVRGLAETYTRDLRKTMFLLFGAVALLLVIGCCNVSILLFARGTARQHEFAIRSAVGASGFRIVRQLLGYLANLRTNAIKCGGTDRTFYRSREAKAAQFHRREPVSGDRFTSLSWKRNHVAVQRQCVPLVNRVWRPVGGGRQYNLFSCLAFQGEASDAIGQALRICE